MFDDVLRVLQGCLLFVLIGTPACVNKTAKQTGSSDAESHERSSPPPSHDVAQTSGEKALADFLAGRTRISLGPAVFLSGKDLGPCKALPDKRPEGFFLDYSWRPSGDVVDDPVIPTRYAVGAKECEVNWGHLHLGQPQVRCTLLDDDVFDDLYLQIRELRPAEIETRTITDPYRPIHRGGYAVRWHWNDNGCALSDMADSEVVPAAADRFQRLVSLAQAACNAGKHADCR